MKNKIIVIVVVLLVGLASFFGGMKYGQSKTPALGANFLGANGSFVAGARGARGAMAGGFTGGQIIFKDATSLTVSAQGGGSKIVFITGSTPVQKSVSGTVGDLTVGENITVTGTANSDGSITAQSIQVRPATTTRVQ